MVRDETDRLNKARQAEILRTMRWEVKKVLVAAVELRVIEVLDSQVAGSTRAFKSVASIRLAFPRGAASLTISASTKHR